MWSTILGATLWHITWTPYCAPTTRTPVALCHCTRDLYTLFFLPLLTPLPSGHCHTVSSVCEFVCWLVGPFYTPHVRESIWSCPFPRQYNPNTHETFAKPFFSSKQMLFSPEYRVQMFKRFLNSHLQVNGGHACKWDNFTKIAQCHKQMQSVCP